MKIIFFGLGSIGQRHARILLKSYPHKLYAFRSGKNREKNDLGIEELTTWDEVERLKPDVAFITNPTSLHIEVAFKCAKLGIKLFIEKPIGKDLKGLNKLLKVVSNQKLVTYVGYDVRFHPVIVYLKKFINGKKVLHLRATCTSFYPNWRPGRNHLEVYTAQKKIGGGVILDLSHELDYVSYLLGPVKKIKGSFEKRGNVTVDAEDYADILVNTSTAPANIHINFLSHQALRQVHIDLGDSTLVGDLLTGEIKHFKKEKLYKNIKLDYYRDQLFEQQLKYFFKNIDNPQMMNSLIEADPLFKQIINFKNG